MNKKSFFIGTLCGVLITALISCGLFCSRFLINKSEYKKELVATDEEITDKLEAINGLIDRFYLYEEEVEEKELIDGIYAGYVAYLGDVYSAYYSVDETKEFNELLEGSYCGIGVMMSMNYDTGEVTFIECYEGSGAYDSGVLVNDILVEVDGEDIAGMDLSAISAKVKGEEGTTVKIKVKRDNEYKEFEIVRKMIEYPCVEYEVLEGNIGYIVLSDFEGSSVSQFEKAYEELKEQGVQGLIIDLRNNPGGLITAVSEILNHFVPDDGLIVYTENKYGRRNELYATTESYCMVPFAVLVNGESASASEIFAGAVQSHDSGTVIGTTTFGKGLVQQIFSLNDGSSVKLTIEKYFTPSGEDIHGVGITPDIEVQLGDDVENIYEVPFEKDTQLHAAIEHIKSEMKK